MARSPSKFLPSYKYAPVGDWLISIQGECTWVSKSEETWVDWPYFHWRPKIDCTSPTFDNFLHLTFLDDPFFFDKNQSSSLSHTIQSACHCTSITMVSTIIDKSGHEYIQGEVLQRHYKDHKHNVFKTEYVLNFIPFSRRSHVSNTCHSRPGSESFVLNHVLQPFFYNLSLSLSHPSLQAPVGFECNRQEELLVCSYSKGTLVALIHEDPDCPVVELNKIVQCLGEVIQELQ